MKKTFLAVMILLIASAWAWPQEDVDMSDAPTIDLTGRRPTVRRQRFLDKWSFCFYGFDNAMISGGVGYFIVPKFWVGLDVGSFFRDEPPAYKFMSINIETGYLFGNGRGVPVIHRSFGEVREARQLIYGGCGLIQKFSFPLTYIPVNYSRLHWEPGFFIGLEGGTIPVLFRLIFYIDPAIAASDFSIAVGLKI